MQCLEFMIGHNLTWILLLESYYIIGTWCVLNRNELLVGEFARRLLTSILT